MGRRRKTLKRRLYTYEQLDARCYKARDKYPSTLPFRGPPLYGNVSLSTIGGGFCIRYEGKHAAFRIADVYRTRDGTVYEVHGIGTLRNKPSVRKEISLWERYAAAFTPHDVSQRLCRGERAFYLMRGDTITAVASRPGIWKSLPRVCTPRRDEWASGGKSRRFHSLPNFTRRCRLFATRLRKSLEEDGMGVMQLRSDSLWFAPDGTALHVCTPPTDTQDGRLLLVQVCVYNAEARSHHHVDGDFAIKNCQFFALEDGRSKARKDVLRWKRSRDAINGIREWIFGDIYIPGPG